MSNDIELPPLPKRLAVSVWPAYSEGQIEDYAREAVRLDRQKRFAKERAQLDAEWVALRGMREAEKRTSVEAMREALEKLARLGNGDQYGNSVGNDIAAAEKIMSDQNPSYLWEADRIRTRLEGECEELRIANTALRKAMEIAADQILHSRSSAWLTITNALRAAFQAQPAENPDAIRLDWMQENLLNKASIRIGTEFREVNAWSICADGTDLRATIDAAMKGQS